MLAILSVCPSFLAHAVRPRSRRSTCRSAHPACFRMSEGSAPSSELRVEIYAPLVSPGQAKKGVTFEKRLAQLRALCEQHGHALPAAEHGSDLVRWAARQRTLYRQGSLAETVIEELDAVHFVWDPLQAAWDARFEELEAFYGVHGHCNVPADGPLGGWVARQRRQYRQGALRPERCEALGGVDFEWDPIAARWERSFAQYAAARRAAAAVPPPLARWASRQRKAHAAGRRESPSPFTLPLTPHPHHSSSPLTTHHSPLNLHPNHRLTGEHIEALNQLEGWEWVPRRTGRSAAALRRLGLRLSRELGGESEAGEGSAMEGSAMEGSAVEGGVVGGGVAGGERGGSYARCESVGRALVISVGARREEGAAAELCDAREALRLLGYSVVTVANPTASELVTFLTI